MIVTEKEIVGIKFCPAALARADYDKCQGSNCMAWRWWDKWGDKPMPERRGYCGLSGKPENE